MKWLKLLFILILGGCDPMAISVPDTNTFSLQNVVAAVEDHAGELPADDALQNSFDYSNPLYFDGAYDNINYAPDDSMKRFRNYGPHNDPDNGTYPIFVPGGFSPNGDGVNDYFVVQNLEHYPTHKMSIFDRFGNLLYQRTNNYHQYPWDGRYNGMFVAAGNYTWVLEINGSPYDSGTVMVAY